MVKAMVQSPFRHRKPRSSSRLSLFCNAPNLSTSDQSDRGQRTTIFIAGDSVVGDAARPPFILDMFRGLWNPAAGRGEGGRGKLSNSRPENGVKDVREGDDDLESSVSTLTGVGGETGDGNDGGARRGPPPASEGDQDKRCAGLTPSPTKLFTSKKDVLDPSFLSPYRDSSNATPLADLPPMPPTEEPRSVSIGGRIITGERCVPNNMSRTFEPKNGSESESGHLQDSIVKIVVSPSRPKQKSSMVQHATPSSETRGKLRQQLRTVEGSGGERRRLSKRARTRLTMREVNSHIQPGRNYNSMEMESMGHFERRKALTLPKMIDFFRRIEIKLILVNSLISVALTAFVLVVCPISWQDRLQNSSAAVSVLGAFLSFALVFRTQACYARWWEARTQWGRMTSALINLAGQARSWFGDEESVDRFLAHCVVFPYACKAVLRGNPLTDPSEEGPRFLKSGMLTDADLGAIVRHGRPPFVCLEFMRRTAREALREGNDACELPPATLSGALLAMEQIIWELSLNFGACLKINGTRMPASYAVFMRSFVVFFFVLVSLSWAPSIRWLTPVITGFMVFSINTVIVIGDQMMRPFELQWAGLPLQKFCVIVEHEITNVSRRHADINSLFST